MSITYPDPHPISERVQTVEYYDDDGEKTKDANLFTAKCVKTGENVRYFVMANQRGRFKKPRDAAYMMESFRLAKLSGLSAFKVVACNKVNFEHYIEFLKTGKVANLRIAERGIV